MAYVEYDPLTTLRSLQAASAMKDAAQERKVRAMQLAEAQRQMDEQAATRAAYAGAITTPESSALAPGGGSSALYSAAGVGQPQVQGPPELDRAKVLSALAANPNTAYQVPNVQSQFDAQDQAKRQAALDRQTKLAQLSKDQLANYAAFSKQHAQDAYAAEQITDPQQQAAFVHQKLNQYVAGGFYTPEEAQQAWQFYQSNPQQALKMAQMQGIEASSVYTQAQENQRAKDKDKNSQAGRDARAQDILAKVNSGQPVTQDDVNFFNAYRQGKTETSTKIDPMGIDNSTTVKAPGGFTRQPIIIGGAQPAPSPAAAPLSQKPGPVIAAPLPSAVRPAGQPAAQSASQDPADAVLATIPPQARDLVKQIGTGKMAVGRMAMLLRSKPMLAEMVVKAYPDFDSSKVDAYVQAYKDFTSGTTSKQINAGAVAIQHLKQLNDINNANPIAARTPGTDAYKKFENLLSTVADELITFYGEPKTNEARDAKISSLGGKFGSREAAIREQANAMGVKMDELEQKWKNAAPSSSYEAPMPGMSDKAKQARSALDPTYQQGDSGMIEFTRDANGQLVRKTK